MGDNLYEKTYYTSKYIDFLISNYIREYDIRKAGQTALLLGNCISKDQYNYLCSLPRDRRQIETGLLIKNNKGFDEVRKSFIQEARKFFIEQNELDDSDILSIKNDAIYVINKIPNHTVFYNGILEFVPKNIYTSYYRYNRIEMFYYNDMISDNEKLDIKNIGDDKLVYHKEFMMDFLMYIFDLAQTSNIIEVVNTMQNMLNQYINLDLSLGYYREFNARSCFKFNISEFTNYYAEFIPDNTDKKLLDIRENFQLLQYFYKIFTNIYFSRV